MQKTLIAKYIVIFFYTKRAEYFETIDQMYFLGDKCINWIMKTIH